MNTNAELFALYYKERTTRDIIVAVPGYFTSICDVTSQSVCLTLRLGISDPDIHINRSLGGKRGCVRLRSPLSSSHVFFLLMDFCCEPVCG